jgi:hypothetical protein
VCAFHPSVASNPLGCKLFVCGLSVAAAKPTHNPPNFFKTSGGR